LEANQHHWYNAGMLKRRQKVLITLVVAGWLVVACGLDPASMAPEQLPVLEGTLRPYPSDTPSATPFPTGYSSPTPSPTVTPTPTPVYYNVQDGDDMYGIAFFYGISPQELMTANPSVNPRAMGPAITLVIPITPGPEGTPTSQVTSTPTPTQPYTSFGQPDCYPDGTGGLWCFVLIENGQEGALENVSGLVTLSSGEDLWIETAVMPLNLLPKGASLPLIAYFSPPIPEEFSSSADVEFYLPVMADDDRYLPVEISEQRINLSDDGKIAQVRGKLTLTDENSNASYLWLHATAFDEDGHVVAARRWEAEGLIEAGETRSFSFVVYSLGGAIDHVEVLAEAFLQRLPTPTPTP
jgi:hypothetical protein